MGLTSMSEPTRFSGMIPKLKWIVSGTCVAALTLLYTMWNDRQGQLMAERLEAERRAIAAQVEAERQRFQAEQNDRLIEALRAGQAAGQVLGAGKDVQPDPPPVEDPIVVNPRPKAVDPSIVVERNDPTGNGTTVASAEPSSGETRVVQLPAAPDLRVFDTLGLQDFTLCGHPGFQIDPKTSAILITNRNRDFEHRNEPAFSLEPWKATVAADALQEVFPGCTIKVSPRSNFSTTYYIISEIHARGA